MAEAAGSGAEPRRYNGIDILKAIGIAVVIWIHAFQLLGNREPEVIRRLAFLTRFAVPAFFFASGFLYAVGPPISWRRFATHRLVRLLLPYLVASLLAWAFRWLVLAETISLDQVLFDFATGGAWGIYYFVPLIVGAAVVAQCVFRFRPLAWPLFIVFWVLGLLSEMWIIAFGDLYVQARSPFRWWGYFFAGWVVAPHFARLQGLPTRWRTTIGCLALGITITLFAYYTVALPPSWSPQAAALQYVGIYGSLVGLLMLTLTAAEVQAARWLSEATYPIYLYHFFFIVAAHRVVAPPGGSPIAFVFGCAGSLAVVYAGRRVFGRYARLALG